MRRRRSPPENTLLTAPDMSGQCGGGRSTGRPRAGRAGVLDLRIDYLHQRWNDGVTKASAPFCELHERGYHGSYGAVRGYIKRPRTPTAEPPPPRPHQPHPRNTPWSGDLAWRSTAEREQPVSISGNGLARGGGRGIRCRRVSRGTGIPGGEIFGVPGHGF
jgi:hypothetical protein